MVFSSFLKAFSQETDLLVSLGDSSLKTQNSKGKFVLTKINLVETKTAVYGR